MEEKLPDRRSAPVAFPTATSDYKVFMERLANDVSGLLLSSPLPHHIASSFAGMAATEYRAGSSVGSDLGTERELMSNRTFARVAPNAFEDETKNWTFTQEDENDPAQMVIVSK